MSLVMIQDTREKFNHHNNIENYCKQHNLPIIRTKLDVGDYRLAELKADNTYEFINNVSVDIKGGGCLELAQDLYQDRLVFNRKYRKSYRSGTKLIVLTEEYIKSVDELCRWQNSHTKIKGKFVYDMIRDVSKSYGVKFYFCDKKDTGKYLISLLQYYDKGG